MLNEIFKVTKKKFSVSEKKGFVVRQKGKEIPLNCLSSGEKNILFVYFELLFNTSGFDVILIDEPEISLHIEWQERFIDDILKISSLSDIQVIIATHSPNIVNGHFDLFVDKKVEEYDN